MIKYQNYRLRSLLPTISFIPCLLLGVGVSTTSATPAANKERAISAITHRIVPKTMVSLRRSMAADKKAVKTQDAATSDPTRGQKLAKKPAHSFKAPRTPKGLKQCEAPIGLSKALPQQAGEQLVYDIAISGIQVGQAIFQIENTRPHGAQQIAEYRGQFELAPLISTFLPGAGRAAAVADVNNGAPLFAMNSYSLKGDKIQEEQEFLASGATTKSVREKRGKKKVKQRSFPGVVWDFMTAFYGLRAIDLQQEKACIILYGNQKAYTLWLEPAGQQEVRTPVGMRPATKIKFRYASEKSKTKIWNGSIWLSADAAAVPYKAELIGDRSMRATITDYRVRP